MTVEDSSSLLLAVNTNPSREYPTSVSWLLLMMQETLYQSTKAGKKFTSVLAEKGIICGIKVDKGLAPMAGTAGESWCMGLEGLDKRCAEYYQAGARFAKWRSVVSSTEA